MLQAAVSQFNWQQHSGHWGILWFFSRELTVLSFRCLRLKEKKSCGLKVWWESPYPLLFKACCYSFKMSPISSCLYFKSPVWAFSLPLLLSNCTVYLIVSESSRPLFLSAHTIFQFVVVRNYLFIIHFYLFIESLKIHIFSCEKRACQRTAVIPPLDGTAPALAGCHMTAREETHQEATFVCIEGCAAFTAVRPQFNVS